MNNKIISEKLEKITNETLNIILNQRMNKDSAFYDKDDEKYINFGI